MSGIGADLLEDCSMHVDRRRDPEKQHNPNRQAINLVDKQFLLNANRCQNASYFYGQVTLKNATIDYVTAAAWGDEKCRLAVAGTGLWEAGSLGLRDVIITWRKSPDVT